MKPPKTPPALVGGPGPDPFTALVMAVVAIALVGALVSLSVLNFLQAMRLPTP